MNSQSYSDYIEKLSATIRPLVHSNTEFYLKLFIYIHNMTQKSHSKHQIYRDIFRTIAGWGRSPETYSELYKNVQSNMKYLQLEYPKEYNDLSLAIHNNIKKDTIGYSSLVKVIKEELRYFYLNAYCLSQFNMS